METGGRWSKAVSCVHQGTPVPASEIKQHYSSLFSSLVYVWGTPGLTPWSSRTHGIELKLCCPSSLSCRAWGLEQHSVGIIMTRRNVAVCSSCTPSSHVTLVCRLLVTTLAMHTEGNCVTFWPRAGPLRFPQRPSNPLVNREMPSIHEQVGA